MDPDAVERKLAAILSADVAGYSRLMAQDEVNRKPRWMSHEGAMDDVRKSA